MQRNFGFKADIQSLIIEDTDAFKEFLTIIEAFLQETKAVEPLIKGERQNNKEFMTKYFKLSKKPVKCSKTSAIRYFKTPTEMVDILHISRQEFMSESGKDGK